MSRARIFGKITKFKLVLLKKFQPLELVKMIKQIIIRNDSSSGYKIISDNLENNVDDISDDLMINLIPKCANKDKINYFFKETLNNEVLVKLVCDNDFDEYNRPIAKSHCLLIPEEVYIEKGLSFFLFPLFSENFPLIKDEFISFEEYPNKKSLRITSATKKLLQAVLLYNQVIILTRTPDKTLINQLAELIATIDEFLPYELSKTLRIKSYINNKHFSDINIGITNDTQIINYSEVPNKDVIIFKSDSNPFNLETDQAFTISPIIDDIISTVINPNKNEGETLQSLFDILFSISSNIDPRIDFNFKEKLIQRWNIKKSRNFKLKKFFKKNFSRSSPKSLS